MRRGRVVLEWKMLGWCGVQVKWVERRVLDAVLACAVSAGCSHHYEHHSEEFSCCIHRPGVFKAVCYSNIELCSYATESQWSCSN